MVMTGPVIIVIVVIVYDHTSPKTQGRGKEHRHENTQSFHGNTSLENRSAGADPGKRELPRP